MRKLLGTVFNLLTVLFVLLLVAVVTLFVIVDPDQYRRPLEELISRSTGLQLEIAGDMRLQLRPTVAIEVTDLRLRDPAQPREMASLATLLIRIDPWELLQSRLVMQELNAEYLHINWYTDETGHNGWSAALQQLSGQPPAESMELGNLIRLVEVVNGSIDIQDQQRNLHVTLRGLSLTGRNSNTLAGAFRIRTEFDYSRESGGPPQHVTATSLNRANLNRGDIDLQELLITLTPLQLEGDLQVRDLFSGTSLSGKLVSNTLPLPDLLSALGLRQAEFPPLDMGISARDGRDDASLQFTFNGDRQQLRIPSATVAVGGTTINGDAVIRYSDGLAPAIITFRAQSGPLDLTPYLDRANEPVVSTQAVPVTMPWRIPAQWFSGKTVQGSIGVESLHYRDIRTGTFTVFTNLEDRVLDVEAESPFSAGGRARLSMRLDRRGQVPALDLQVSTAALELTGLALPILPENTLGGQLTLQSRFQSRGNAPSDWLANMDGYAGFSLANSMVDIGVVKQVFNAITTLSPTVEPVQQWPDVQAFSSVGGYAVFGAGTGGEQEVRLRMDNIDVHGSGRLDAAAGAFDFQLAFTMLGAPMPQPLPLNPLYHNVRWPVRCAALLTADPSQMCQPDFQRVRQLFTSIAAGQTANGIDALLADPFPPQLPVELQGMLPGPPVPTALP